MNVGIKEIQKAEKEITKLNDEELVILERIAYEELIKREAKKMILRLVDQQKQPR